MPRAAKKESSAAVIGAIEGVPIGKWWPNRNEVVASHVHAYIVAGIHGRKKVGAFSVVLTADSRWPDEDHGETFTYIGSGGGEPGKRSGRQVADQKMTNSRNASLEKSTQTRKPVRVIRGPAGIDSRFAPYYGFRYDGLYLVSNARTEDGPNGFKICKFDFTRMDGQAPLPSDRSPFDEREYEARKRQYMRALLPQTAEGDSEADVSESEHDNEVQVDSTDHVSIDVEALLATFPDEVEEALEPVLPELVKFTRPGDGRIDKKARKKPFYIIAKHITAVIEQKAKDGRDAQWWDEQLWDFVVKATWNKTPTATAEKYKQIYAKYQKKIQDKLELKTQATTIGSAVSTGR